MTFYSSNTYLGSFIFKQTTQCYVADTSIVRAALQDLQRFPGSLP